MVTTRASRRKESEDTVASSSSSSSSSEEESTAQVTLESSDESAASNDKQQQDTALQGASRLFSPYRTLGIVSSGAPYHVETHSNSTNALVTLPIGERFHVFSCDKLQPVLVSQAVSGGTISHLVADSSLSITIVAHGAKNCSVSLFQRTRPIHTLPKLASKAWSVVDMLHLGKTKVTMTGEKEGSVENAVIVAVVLAKESNDGEEEEDGVPVHGNDDDSSDEEDSDDDSSVEDEADDCHGQVVMLIATRTSIRIQHRIPLTKVPTFQPTVAMHPSTYLNKIVLGGTDSSLVLLNVRTAKLIHVFTCLPESNSSNATVTALEQSPAVDTIAVGMSNGNVHLINLRHDKLLFSLKHKGTSITSLSFRTDGSAMRYGIAPLAVGRSDGTISIWDLTPPEEEQADMGRTLLCQLEKVHVGGVAKLSYFPQEPLLLSIGKTSNSLLMHVFDNPDHSGRLLRQRRGHVAPPRHIRYLHPSSGILPNAADGTDASSCQILSGGGSDRTVRVFSTARSVLDKEYSQGQGLEKRAKQLGLDSTAELLLPPVTGTAMSEARSRDWGDLVTIHRNHAFAYVWSSKRGAQSGPILRQNDWNVSAMQVPPPRTTHATSVTLSSCGNFALVGTVGGTIYKYNVQSGLARGTYPKSAATREDRSGKPRLAGDVNRTMKALEKKMKVSNRKSDVDKEARDAVQAAKQEQTRLAQLARGSHTGAVVGLAVDSVNKTLVSVGSDAKLILWNFATHAPHKKSPFKLPSPATKLCHIRDSDLAAIAMEDFTIVLFDCATLFIVRRFGLGNATVQHSGPISDLAFSPDGRSLYSSSLDGTVRVWDVPTNTCVDWLSFHTPPTSLTVSPTGEFLATTHSDKVGISLWSDRTFYQTVHMDGAHPPTEPARMDDPAPIAETAQADNDDEGIRSRPVPSSFTSKQGTEEDDDDSKLPPAAKEDGLITLSGMPPAHWKNLFHLELVKERNKPKEAPKKPPSAPFFLQWRGGESLGDGDQAAAKEKAPEQASTDKAAEEEAWDAVWSDDDDGMNTDSTGNKRLRDVPAEETTMKSKRPKVTHHRSHLAALLEDCYNRPPHDARFQAVTDHVATLGPSAIDVSLSTLCSGTHDLEEGLPLLHMASLWLLEACQSRQRYEAVNAYLHRFLYLHANVLAGIDSDLKQQVEEEVELTEEELEAKGRIQALRKELLETTALLKEAQQSASDALRGKMQHTLCLLRHFSRMV
jgi:U3 small nucleolar RNA-associated protein 21